MNLKALTSAILLVSLPTTGVFAAALDRSGQSIQAFLQPGNYFEAGISVLDADVSGKMRDDWRAPVSTSDHTKNLAGTEISDMAESYYFPSAALKLQLNDQLSFGLIYDQPFGAKAEYSGNDKVLSKSDTSQGALNGGKFDGQGQGAFIGSGESTKVDVTTQNLSLIFGYQPTENWNVYAGPVYQTVKGDVQLRGAAYGPFGGSICAKSLPCGNFHEYGTTNYYKGYNANIGEDSAVGWLAGFAYQIPDIALKASLTYRSEIDHTVSINESVPFAKDTWAAGPVPGLKNITYTEGSTKVTTPQSVNLDLQTGIMANTVAFAQLRWVEWSKFSIRPHQFNQASQVLTQSAGAGNDGFALVAYDKDQLSANIGVGRKFNEQWAGTVMVGWDSGAGNPVSTLGPTEGYWSVGLGGQFSPTPQTFIQAGVKYFMLGDAKAQVASYYGTDIYDAEFKDNDAIGYSLKMGYRF